MSGEVQALAAAVQSRRAHAAVSTAVSDKSLDISEVGRAVLEEIGRYYDRDPAAHSCDRDVLTDLVLGSVNNPKHRDLFAAALENVFSAEVSAPNVAAVLLSARRESLQHQCAAALAAGKTDEAHVLMEQLLELDKLADAPVDEDDGVLNDAEVTDLVGEAEDGDLIPVYPARLNKALGGGLMRGHHMLVFARPEVGKTMFLVNMIRGFAKNGFRVLYVGNEEPVRITNIRVLQRLADMTQEEVLKHRTKAVRLARELGYQNVYMKQLTPGTPREIEALCEEIKPDVLLVDQLRHLQVSGNRDGNFVRQLEMAANAVRQIGARQNCLVVSVTQAGESAANKAILDMEDVDFSNTGVQGAVDVMVGIGMSRNDEAAGRRTISLPKNKRTGEHAHFVVRVDPTKNRIISSA